MLPGFLAALSLTILGPGALAPADPLVLERVEVNRVTNGWALHDFAGVGVVRIAVEDCGYLGRDGLVIVGDVAHAARVVDCQRRDERPRLSELGIVADVSKAELGHEKATILLWGN